MNEFRIRPSLLGWNRTIRVLQRAFSNEFLDALPARSKEFDRPHISLEAIVEPKAPRHESCKEIPMHHQTKAGLGRLKAKDVMSKRVLSLTPNTSLRRALDVLTRGMITGAPVVNEVGRPIGVFSYSSAARSSRCEGDTYYSSSEYEDIGDIAEASPAAMLDLNTVGGLMNPLVIVASPQDSLAQIARIMMRRRVHRVVITDKGRIVGVVSSMDIVRAFAGAGARRKPRSARVRLSHS
jgi:CBS domain-containing protein